MAKVFLVLMVYTSFSFQFPFSIHRTFQENEHFKPSHILMVLSEKECKFSSNALATYFNTLPSAPVSMPCILSHYQIQKGGVAKTSFATPPEKFMSERGDSNARPLRPERSALPTALLSDCTSKVSDFW